MTLVTRHFGEISIDESRLLNFNSGLPGFEHLKRFALLSEKDEGTGSPFYWLQSTEDPSVAFVMMDVIKMYPEYNPLVDKDRIEGELGSYNPDNFFIYNIANIPENVSDTTVNLKAPIVINDDSKKAMQIICDNDDYSVRHYLFK